VNDFELLMNGIMPIGAAISLFLGVFMWFQSKKICLKYRMEAFVWASFFGSKNLSLIYFSVNGFYYSYCDILEYAQN
jgi:hypothetical protein